MPAVSVIMGVYNGAKQPFLDRAIQSILHQTVQDLELIVCDDGSQDGTWPLLCAYREADRRIKLLRSPVNCGLAAALNRCLPVAEGRYIARQDADDRSRTDRLAVQLEFLEQHPEIGFAGSGILLYDASGYWGRRSFPQYPEEQDFLFTVPFSHGALMVRREAYQRVGGYRVARETRRAEDYDLLMRLYAQGVRGANLPDFLYDYLEDEAAEKRRRYLYRIDEAVVRWKGFSALGLLPAGLPYVAKPLVVGLLPAGLLRWLRNHRTIEKIR